MKIYIVTAACGRYSDQIEFSLLSFKTKDKALKYQEELANKEKLISEYINFFYSRSLGYKKNYINNFFIKHNFSQEEKQLFLYYIQNSNSIKYYCQELELVE